MRTLYKIGLLLMGFIKAIPSQVAPSIEDSILIAQNILRLEHRELVYISDRPSDDQSKFIQAMASSDITMINYDPESIYKAQIKRGRDACPIHGSASSPNVTYSSVFIGDNKIFKRSQLIPYLKTSHLIFVMSKNIEPLLKAMELTVMNYCEEKTDRGIFHVDTKIVFILESPNDASIIFSEKRIMEHPGVAAFERNKGIKSSYSVLNVDIMDNNKIRKKFWGTPNKQAESFDEIFPSFVDFKSYKMQIAALPYSFHVTGVERAEDDPLKTANNTYKDYWGFEMYILEHAAKAFNFKYEIWNPTDGVWGSIEDDGKWSGSMSLAKNGQVDMIMSAILQNYPRRLVVDPTIHFAKDYLVTLSPQPTQVPQYFAFIKPFQPFVWITVFGTYGVMTVIFTLVSDREEKIIKDTLEDWSTLKSSGWYTYGTLIGESVTRDTKSNNAKALRWIMIVWLFYCFVISSAYGGELKAYLTQPTFTKPIETLEDVVENDLPWGMILYGELEERIMAKSENKVVQKIWSDKIVLQYTVLPQIEPVYKGEMILIDWKNGLTSGLKIEFSTSGGQPLVHMSKRPIFMDNYSGWAFHLFSPWKKTFDKFIQQCKETGLIDIWIKKTFIRMNNEFLESGKSKKKELGERSSVSPLTLSDTQGIFFLFAFLMSFSLISFAVEKSDIRCYLCNMKEK